MARASRSGAIALPSAVDRVRISARGYDEALVTLGPTPIDVVLHASER